MNALQLLTTATISSFIEDLIDEREARIIFNTATANLLKLERYLLDEAFRQLAYAKACHIRWTDYQRAVESLDYLVKFSPVKNSYIGEIADMMRRYAERIS